MRSEFIDCGVLERPLPVREAPASESDSARRGPGGRVALRRVPARFARGNYRGEYEILLFFPF